MISTVLKYDEFIKWIQDVEECIRQQEEQRWIERKRFAEQFNRWIKEHEESKNIQE